MGSVGEDEDSNKALGEGEEGNVADDNTTTSSFREAWAGNRAAATSCRCTHMCLSSTNNIAKCLVEAVAKAAVFQTAGKPFADPKASVAPLSAELVKSLMGGGSHAEGSAGVLSDLAHAVEEWTNNKKTMFSNMGSLLATGTQSDAIAKLKGELARSEAQGFTPSDRERMSRELLLRVGGARVDNIFQLLIYFGIVLLSLPPPPPPQYCNITSRVGEKTLVCSTTAGSWRTATRRSRRRTSCSSTSSSATSAPCSAPTTAARQGGTSRVPERNSVSSSGAV
jgi:hypothetical protein